MTRRSSATGAAQPCLKRENPHSRSAPGAARLYLTNWHSSATGAARESPRHRSYAAAAAARPSITSRASVPAAAPRLNKNRSRGIQPALPVELPTRTASRSSVTAAGRHSTVRERRQYTSRVRLRLLSRRGNLPDPCLHSRSRIPIGNHGTICPQIPVYHEPRVLPYRNHPRTMTGRLPFPRNTMPTSLLLPKR